MLQKYFRPDSRDMHTGPGAIQIKIAVCYYTNVDRITESIQEHDGRCILLRSSTWRDRTRILITERGEERNWRRQRRLIIALIEVGAAEGAKEGLNASSFSTGKVGT